MCLVGMVKFKTITYHSFCDQHMRYLFEHCKINMCKKYLGMEYLSDNEQLIITCTRDELYTYI